MSTVNNHESTSPDFTELQTLIAANLAQQAKNSEKRGDSQASLAQLSQTLEEVLEQITPNSGKTSNGKVVHVNFRAAPPTSSNGGPTNAQMQQAIGELMELLAELQGKIAEYGNKNAQANSTIGLSLVKEMHAQLNEANNNLKKLIEQEKQSDFWSSFTKIAEGIAGVLISGIALLCGQPELAVIVMAFTILAVSGGMDKMTQGLSDGISKILVAAGMPKDEADAIAKVAADVVIIVATVVLTAATCGGGAAAAAEEITEDATIEGTEMQSVVANTAAEETEEVAETTETFSQQLQNFLSKAGTKIKESNPFGKLSRRANLAITAGAQGTMSTNFGGDFTNAVLLHMKDGKTKEILQETLGIVMSLMTALVGAGSGAALFSTPGLYGFNNLSKVIKAFLVLQTGSAMVQFTGEVGKGTTYLQQATTLNEQSQTQALISELQALLNMNDKQQSAGTKATSAQTKAWSESLVALSYSLNRVQQEVANVLRA